MVEPPGTYGEAMRRPEATSSKKAFKDELQLLNENGVFTVVDLPKGKKTVTAMWVMKRKMNFNGSAAKL